MKYTSELAEFLNDTARQRIQVISTQSHVCIHRATRFLESVVPITLLAEEIELCIYIFSRGISKFSDSRTPLPIFYLCITLHSRYCRLFLQTLEFEQPTTNIQQFLEFRFFQIFECPNCQISKISKLLNFGISKLSRSQSSEAPSFSSFPNFQTFRLANTQIPKCPSDKFLSSSNL